MQEKKIKIIGLLDKRELSAMTHGVTRDRHRLKEGRLRLEIRKPFPKAKGGVTQEQLNHGICP